MPKTTGSNETDELLATLHRNSNQLQNLINLMDSVANGKTDVALTPLQSSDRLSVSFQRLVAKVTDSIDAKNELNELHAAIDQLRSGLVEVRDGDLTVMLQTASAPMKEFAETVNFLSHRLNRMVTHIQQHASVAKTSAAEAKETIAQVLDQHETRAARINRLASAFREYPNSMQSIVEELGTIVTTINKTQAAAKGSEPQRENLNAVNSLRKQITDAIKRIRGLSDHSSRIEQAAKTAEDLSRRSNLISLNASVQRSDMVNSDRRGSSVIDGIDFLAVRAEGINREISEINKTLRAEIDSAMACLNDAVSEASEISVRTIRDGDSHTDLLRIFERITNLRSKIAASSSDQTNERENALQMFTATTAEAGQTSLTLHECETNLENLNSSFEDLASALSDLKLKLPEEELSGEASMTASTYRPNDTMPAGGELEL